MIHCFWVRSLTSEDVWENVNADISEGFNRYTGNADEWYFSGDKLIGENFRFKKVYDAAG